MFLALQDPKMTTLMSLEAGRKLAQYEILEPIGNGGMGEVFRARDGKLGATLPSRFCRKNVRLHDASRTHGSAGVW